MRFDRHSCSAQRSAFNDSCELMTQHKRIAHARSSSRPFGIPVNIRAANANGRYPQQQLARLGLWFWFIMYTDITNSV
jgi:hypothetical protein